MSTYRVSATRAVREFSELLRRAGDGGQEVLIERHSKAVARLSPAGLSPVRWVDFVRNVRRSRSPDAGFVRDLLAARGWRSAPDLRPTMSAQPGTVLLDSYLLLDANRSHRLLPNLQRVATTAAAIAELSSLVDKRGEAISLVRLSYLRRIASVLPVVSFDQPAALAVASCAPPRSDSLFELLARATADSLDWLLVS